MSLSVAVSTTKGKSRARFTFLEYMVRDPAAKDGVSYRTMMIPPGFEIAPELQGYYRDTLKTATAFKEVHARHGKEPIHFVLVKDGKLPIGAGTLDYDTSVEDIAFIACILCECESAPLAFVMPKGITHEDKAACEAAGGKVYSLVKKAAA